GQVLAAQVNDGAEGGGHTGEARIEGEEAGEQRIRYLLALIPGTLDVGGELQSRGTRGGAAAKVPRARHHAQGRALFAVTAEKHIRRAAKRTAEQRTDRAPDGADG